MTLRKIKIGLTFEEDDDIVADVVIGSILADIEILLSEYETATVRKIK